MSRGAKTLTLLLAALAICSAARAQDFEEPVFDRSAAAIDRMIWPNEPAIPVMPYESPLENVFLTTEFIGFRRDARLVNTFASVGTRATDAFTGRDLNFVNQPGLRLLGGMKFNDCFSVEASFLGLLDWDVAQAVQNQTVNPLGTAGNLLSPLRGWADPAVAGFDFLNYVEVQTTTHFNNAEVNARAVFESPYANFQASGLVGLRYMNIHEQFLYRSTSAEPAVAGTANTAAVKTNNNLYGPQLGLTTEFRFERRAWLTLDFKGALLQNDASQETAFTTGPLVGAGATTNGARAQGRAAVAVDLQAACAWKFTPFLVGRVGYQAIFIEGVALGADNFAQNALFMTTNPNLLAYNGGVTFHGPFGGVTFTW